METNSSPTQRRLAHLPTPSTVKEVHSVLGVLGYQHPFIPNYANIAHLLVALTKNDQPFLWTPLLQSA
jgi:hypothetical protein